MSEYWIQQKSCCRCVQLQDVLLTPSFLPATFIHTSDLALSTHSGSVFPKVARDGHALYLAVPARTRPSYSQLRALVAHVRCPALMHAPGGKSSSYHPPPSLRRSTVEGTMGHRVYGDQGPPQSLHWVKAGVSHNRPAADRGTRCS